MIDVLTKCDLFRGINKVEKEKIIADFHIQIKFFEKGETIVYANEVVVQQLILVEGDIKIEMTGFSGKTINIADIGAPKILAPAFLFGRESYFPVSLIAKNNCRIVYIAKQNFLDTLLKYPTLQINFLNIISDQTQFLTKKIYFLNFKTIKGKIAHFVLKQSEIGGANEIRLKQSLAQIAGLFGVARPSLSRALSELHQERVIDYKKSVIKILDMDALKAHLG